MVISRIRLLLRIVRGLKLDEILFNSHEHSLKFKVTLSYLSRYEKSLHKFHRYVTC